MTIKGHMRAAVFGSAIALIALGGSGGNPAHAQTTDPGENFACDAVTNSGTDYRAAATAGQNYANMDLTNADFRGTDLTGTIFDGADLTGANLAGAILAANGPSPTSFSEANLTNACLDTVTINGSAAQIGADFQFANLTCTGITGSDITWAAFGPEIQAAPTDGACRTSFGHTVLTCEFMNQWKDLDLSYADVSACKDRLAGFDLTNAVMEGVQFPYFDLTSTDFSGADVSYANFYSATLSHALFTSANLQFATLSSAQANSADFTNQAQLSGATLSYGNFESAKFNTAFFEQSNDIPAATMSFGDFHLADFTQAAMVGVNLSGASLYDGTILASATIQNSNFSNSTLWNLNLKSAKLSGITFDYANLINADLSGATLVNSGNYRAASLVKSNLQGVDLTETNLDGINMTNAAVALDDGVPLFTLTDGVADLESDLDNGWLTTELNAAFENNGFALSYCASPDLSVIQSGATWNIVLRQRRGVGPSDAQYRDFVLTAETSGNSMTGVTVSGLADGTATELFSISGEFTSGLDRLTLPRAVFEGFEANAYPLPSCSNPLTDYNRTRNYWTLETSLASDLAPVVGYTGFKLISDDTGGAETLKVFGTDVMTLYQGPDGRLTYTVLTVSPTKFSTQYFSDTTVTPNGNTYGANKAAGVSLDDMMTAPSPPSPPTCAPGSMMC